MKPRTLFMAILFAILFALAFLTMFAGITALYTAFIYLCWECLHILEFTDEPRPFMDMWPIVAVVTFVVAMFRSVGEAKPSVQVVDEDEPPDDAKEEDTQNTG